MATVTAIASAGRSIGLVHRLARAAVLARMSRLERGTLHVMEPSGSITLGGGGLPEATVTVLDPEFWTALVRGGTVGAGESYMAGHWQASDLAALMRLITLNREVLVGLEGGWARLAAPGLRLFQALHRNSRRGARHNIARHYDLGNEFFALFLDETMSYSCALFERAEATLAEASLAKIDHTCRQLGLGPEHHLLEIGTGWGTFAIHAARHYGCRVTTTTISSRQHALARERIESAGLGHRIELLQDDYRDLRGTYDRIVSIEMIEAVGHEYYPRFFATLGRLLRPDGLALVQAITIADQHYEQARRGVDFIKRYIFPGACIPSLTALVTAMTTASDLRLVHLDDLTPHYARTLAGWRENLLARREEVLALGFDIEFLRRWEYYMALCEGGFAERYLGDVQLLFARPDNRRDLFAAAATGR